MYKFGQQPVFIPEKAEIYRSYFGGGRMRKRPRHFKLVQEALDEFAQEQAQKPLEWSLKRPVIFTLDGTHDLRTFIHERRPDERVLWGTYRFHSANSPQPSPFVERKPRTTTSLTIELVGSPERPILTRVYAGEYAPPLPWQSSVGDCYGGRDASVKFWSNHAFAHSTEVLCGDLVDTVPDWAKVCAVH